MKETVSYEISQEEFEKAKHNGAYSLIGAEIKRKYLVTEAEVHRSGAKYFLTFKKGFPFGKGGAR